MALTRRATHRGSWYTNSGEAQIIPIIIFFFLSMASRARLQWTCLKEKSEKSTRHHEKLKNDNQKLLCMRCTGHELSKQLEDWLNGADLSHGPARAIIAPLVSFGWNFYMPRWGFFSGDQLNQCEYEFAGTPDTVTVGLARGSPIGKLVRQSCKQNFLFNVIWLIAFHSSWLPPRSAPRSLEPSKFQQKTKIIKLRKVLKRWKFFFVDIFIFFNGSTRGKQKKVSGGSARWGWNGMEITFFNIFRCFT